MLSRRMLDKNYVAAGAVLENKKTGSNGKIIPLDLNIRRKLALWASYNDRIEKACGQPSQR